ncbi:hypothetical protein QBC47DRAFT_180283 [Echria macrotheca]|uniref:Glycine-rich cell wall structural protein 1 n=1 Tax=Echria macrotheca TaxID=438768 RepID=A0AAJ0BDN3_9PEZI|nr:hypothetical protein QBC47DRAFT_180283 [Echria macrotheca]
MESITSLKTAATRAIWGDEKQHQEPISGQNGDVSKGEPYDAGNMEPEEASSKFTAPDETGTQPVETNTKETTSNGTHTDDNLNKDDKPETNPATQIDSSTTKHDSTKAQNDVRSPSDPTTHPDSAAPRTNIDNKAEGGLDVDDNPEKQFDGPGPRPIEQVAREHGGDAGKSGSDESLSDDKKGEGEKGEGKGEGPGGLPKVDGGENEGTGELYVKSSGLKADGGDFDAAKPGAGREADRLLEEKGIHKDAPNGPLVTADGTPASPETSNGSAGGKEKVSLKSKIKAKLHRTSATAAS